MLQSVASYFQICYLAVKVRLYHCLRYTVDKPYCCLRLDHLPDVMPSVTDRDQIPYHFPFIIIIRLFAMKTEQLTDDLTSHLEIYGVFMLITFALINLDTLDAARDHVEHREMSKQLHSDKFVLLAVKLYRPKSVFQLQK